jgi:hypothetical protein
MSWFIAQTAANPGSSYFGWIVIGLIVLLGLAVGLSDVLRFSPKRIWAISSVGFRESIRRRVLWVTPLAMIGIIAVTQLAHPVDEQDAIRQTTKYCLFASGIVVVIATLILACTSLPKEIDNRVIYTIVTKPATRLEIVLGKTLGFARTSALILLIMGLFSYVYLRINAAQLHASIQNRLQTMPASDPSRDTLQHYADEGLLQARTYARPVELQIYARVPKPGDRFTWTFGAGEQAVLFPFALPETLFDPDHAEAQLVFNFQIATDQPRPLTRREIENEMPDPTATTRPSTQGVQKWPGKPRIAITLLNEAGTTIVAPNQLMDVMHLDQVKSNDPSIFKDAQSINLEGITGQSGVGRAIVAVPPRFMQERLKTLNTAADGARHIYVMISPLTTATRFGFAKDAVVANGMLADASGKPMPLPISTWQKDGKPVEPSFRGRLSSTRAQQLRGDSDAAEAPVGIYNFHEPNFVSPAGDTVPFEFRTKIERSGEAEASEADNVTNVELTLFNRKTGYLSPSIMITPDSDRPTFFKAPKAGVDGGDFDLYIRSRTDGHYVGLRGNSVAVVASVQSFAFNLVKSLVILWMLSVLVVIISIFCSTFVSWPIAVVLTLVILLGRWCVVQLGDPSSPQQMATDFFGPNANAVGTRVFTDTVSTLNKFLTFTAKVLPDVDQFRVTEDIERGVTIAPKALLDPLLVILTFGLPMLILAYVFLRKKEVAP